MDYLLAIYLVLCVYTKKSINQSNLMHSINVKVKISLSQLNKKSINILIRCKNEYFLMIQPKPVSLSVISVLLVCRRKLKWHQMTPPPSMQILKYLHGRWITVLISHISFHMNIWSVFTFQVDCFSRWNSEWESRARVEGWR